MSTATPLDTALTAYTPFSHLAGAPFIMPFADAANLVKFSPKLLSEEDKQPQSTDFATWLVEGEIFYTLFCIPDPVGQHDSTVMILYDHGTETLHYLRRDLWIRDCPPNTALLAHFIWDDTGDGAVQPNFLIFDTVRWGGKHMAGVPAASRYSYLRTLKLDSASIISLQFVGELHAIQSFIGDVQTGKIHLPHTVKKCITLTDDPFHPLYQVPAN